LKEGYSQDEIWKQRLQSKYLQKLDASMLKVKQHIPYFHSYWPLTSNYLPLAAVVSNPDRDFGFFHVTKLTS
jgi:hypothetical protein